MQGRTEVNTVEYMVAYGDVCFSNRLLEIKVVKLEQELAKLRAWKAANMPAQPTVETTAEEAVAPEVGPET